MKALIYSAIYGGFDDPIEQPEQTIDTDFVMFSDKPVKSKTWKNNVADLQKHKELKCNNPRMAAKYWKLLIHNWIKSKYDLTIWIDGSVKILREDFAEKCLEWLNGNRMLVFEHPDRDDIYDEFQVHYANPKKYGSQKVKEQEEVYRTEGMPEHNGLYACTIIARQGDTSKFDEAWWQENLKWGYQDQPSFAYLVWKLKQYPEVFPFYQYKNEYVDCSAMNRHKKDT